MHIDIISRVPDFMALRTVWDDIYRQDPEAQYFLSWTFLSRHQERSPGAMLVLGARQSGPDSPYVAFFPMRLRLTLHKERGELRNELNMLGNFAADYAGVVAHPVHAMNAMTAFGRHLKSMHWATLHLESIRMSPERRDAFIKALADTRLVATRLTQVNKVDGIDNAICPVVDLPDSWEGYLETCLSSNMRQKVRRFMRKVELGDEFSITHSDETTFERDLDIVLGQWETRWKERKGKSLPRILRSLRLLIRQSMETNTLRMPILWQGQKPMGALVNFLDPVKGRVLFHLAARDQQMNDIPSGVVLHAHSIRWAIENGYKQYDFMRGNEPYKFTFGTRVEEIFSVRVDTRTGRNLGDKIDYRSIGGASAQAEKFHRQGDLVKAEYAYRLILDTDPGHGKATYGLAQLVSSKGDDWAAADLYRRLVEIAPRSLKAWSRLAITQQSLGRFDLALSAFARALELQPENLGLQLGRARCMAELGRLNEARDAIKLLLDSKTLQPNDEISVRASRLLTTINRRISAVFMPPQKQVHFVEPKIGVGLSENARMMMTGLGSADHLHNPAKRNLWSTKASGKSTSAMA